MAEPFNNIDTVRKTYFINESERSVDPADDAGKVVQLEDDGKISPEFVSVKTERIVYEVAASPATWTKQAGLKRIRVQAWGGGGGGAANSGISTAGGGGGGGYFEAWFEADELGATETVTVGAGGAAVSSVNNGNAGSNSTFGSLLTAYGGVNGTTVAGGVGGDIQTGSTLFRGAQAGVGIYWGGGGGASTSIKGGDALFGGAGGGTRTNGTIAPGSSIYGGDGGAGAASGTATSGSTPGGGGGGCNGGGTSGAGGAGRVIVTEFY